MIPPFGARLRTAMDERGPLCVGIDPHPALLRQWDLDDDAAGLERFALTVVETLADEVAAVKPQSAFFERHGARGVAVLEQVLRASREAGVLTVLDVKRGDIGSTVQGYADAYLDPRSALCADAITATPYLGFRSLEPFLDTALAHGRGVFVVTLTSNDTDGAVVQRARDQAGVTVAGRILTQVAARNAGVEPLGSIGAVVGATIGEVDEDLSVNGPLLAPGLGAQGATPGDLRRVFGPALANVLPASSRDVLAAGPDPGRLRHAAQALRAAVQQVYAEPSTARR